ncbi:MAG TPA: response regulator transcription factor [Acidimicrobiia bacterium]|nr:response regulator transcription factor [Acidimicrobiia bacterium]
MANTTPTGGPSLTDTGESIAVLIVDDHELVAEALVLALNEVPDFHVVGRAGTVEEAVEMARIRRPRVVVVDYRLPDGTGANATTRIREENPDLDVVMLTAHADAKTAAEALEAGCSGFVPKERQVDDLVRAIRGAVAGEIVVPPELLDGLVSRLRPRRPELGDDLTPREVEVLTMLAEGRSTDQIVQTLMLSTHTVRNHIRSILAKLQAHSRLEAVAVAVRLGIVRAGGAK